MICKSRTLQACCHTRNTAPLKTSPWARRRREPRGEEGALLSLTQDREPHIWTGFPNPRLRDRLCFGREDQEMVLGHISVVDG